MIKVKRVEITGMRKVANAKYDLSDINYIVGPNGAGKSTVLNAIQLALLGYIPGQSKKNQDIMKNSSGKVMSVTVTLSDGSQDIDVSRVWTKSGQSVSCKVSVEPEYSISDLISEVELPVFNFPELIGMTANSQKDYFISILPKCDSDIDIASRIEDCYNKLSIPEEYRSEILDPIIKHMSEMSSSGVTKVRELNDWLKSCLSASKTESDMAIQTMSGLTYYSDVKDSISIEECKAKIQECNTYISNRSVYRSQKSAHDNWKAQVEDKKFNMVRNMTGDIETDPEIVLRRDKIANLNKTNESLMDSRKKIEDSIMTILNQIAAEKSSIAANNKIIKSNGICPYSNSSCDHVSNMIESLKLEVADSEKHIDELESKLKCSQNDLKTVVAEYDSYLTKIGELEREVYAIQDMYSVYSTLISSEPSIIDEPAGIENPEEELATYQDMLTKISANEAYNKLNENLKLKKFMLDYNIAALKEFIKLTGPNELQTEMMNKPFEAFADLMDKYTSKLFGKDVHTKFNLSSSANSFSFGIDRNGCYIPYQLLSSGEKCMYWISFALTIIKSNKSNLKLLLMDDMLDHLDANNAKGIFKAISSISDVQIVLAGVITCTESSITQIKVN